MNKGGEWRRRREGEGGERGEWGKRGEGGGGYPAPIVNIPSINGKRKACIPIPSKSE